ncbi:hypothetical protein HON52_00720 [Candidatus Uhrbacteria bacterium]|jgi:hypothetical protein|nr:hypothetical protein [Candidatus Uhrbacteria bacterium]
MNIKNHKNSLRILLVSVAILLLPLFGALVTDQVSWGVADFILAGVLLFISGHVYTFFTNGKKSVAHRAFIAITIVIVLLLIWSLLI